MSDTKRDDDPLPPPVVASDDVEIWARLLDEMKARDLFGRKKYGVPLTVDNGRSALHDLKAELLDALAYTEQAILQQQHGVWIETEASLHAVAKGIHKRTQSGVLRSAAERDALIDVYQAVAQALGLCRQKE